MDILEYFKKIGKKAVKEVLDNLPEGDGFLKGEFEPTKLFSAWCEACGEQLEIGRWEISETRERLFVVPCKCLISVTPIPDTIGMSNEDKMKMLEMYETFVNGMDVPCRDPYSEEE